jgi:hypothetical protein
VMLRAATGTDPPPAFRPSGYFANFVSCTRA